MLSAAATDFSSHTKEGATFARGLNKQLGLTTPYEGRTSGPECELLKHAKKRDIFVAKIEHSSVASTTVQQTTV